MKERVVKGVTHYLFEDLNEFRDKYVTLPIVREWRHSNKGDWILTDDGQVCQVLHLGVLKKSDRKKETTFIRTIMGSYICSPSVVIQG